MRISQQARKTNLVISRSVKLSDVLGSKHVHTAQSASSSDLTINVVPFGGVQLDTRVASRMASHLYQLRGMEFQVYSECVCRGRLQLPLGPVLKSHPRGSPVVVNHPAASDTVVFQRHLAWIFSSFHHDCRMVSHAARTDGSRSATRTTP